MRGGKIVQKNQNEYSCSLTNGQDISAEAAVVLSPENPEVSLECTGGGEFMPRDGAKEPYLTVCPSSATYKQDCELEPVLLTSYLPKAQASWYAITPIPVNNDETHGYKYVFKIPPDGFPPIQTQYKFGCRYPTHEFCMLTATVEPTKAPAEDHNVTCVFSDERPVNFELSISEDKNSAAIACGEYAIPQPWPAYTNSYCSGGSAEPAACAPKPLTDIIPGFEAAWWRGRMHSSHGAVLTIPVGKFPPQPAIFVVGCSRYVDRGPVCNVKVSVAAGTGTNRQQQDGRTGTIMTGSGSLTASGVGFLLAVTLLVSVHFNTAA
ncbi:SAG-related sequence SRS57 [Besnoitia besnoiti]|uniref:SAG-related sequence SRS57 n=1 Tax=Besnoitia besnoiti TaxID=94643 RepID=A0A2A9MP92_BESBE|nr:SAG-related sequence SRS57 [Besnoitia besnoiti]PFH37592.1 SAG-related sequence SRS57 [Besnoitia besnoiti]